MLARNALRLALTLSFSLLAACEVGAVGGPGGGGDDTGGGGDDVGADVDAAPPAASYNLAVTPATASTTLGTKTTFTVSLTSSHFAGPVTLAATGAPSTWTVAINPATVTLTDGGAATATVEVTIPSNGDAATTGAALAINATASPGAKSGTATLTVANEYVMNMGTVGTAAHWGPMSGSLLRLKAGTKLTFKNTDTIPHRIHTGGGVTGFAHEGGDMPAGGSYSVTVGGGSDIFYCHDHGQGTGEVNLTVQ